MIFAIANQCQKASNVLAGFKLEVVFLAFSAATDGLTGDLKKPRESHSWTTDTYPISTSSEMQLSNGMSPIDVPAMQLLLDTKVSFVLEAAREALSRRYCCRVD